MTVTMLYKKFREYPTILTIDDEILWLKQVQTLEIDDIKNNFDDFIFLLERLQLSHQDSGIFEVNAENAAFFFHFVLWVRELQERLGVNLEIYIDGFDTNFDGSLTLKSF